MRVLLHVLADVAGVLIFDAAFDDLVIFGIPGVWGLELTRC
jgi:hypothetical protein